MCVDPGSNNEAATRWHPSKPAPAFARSWQEPSSGATRFANPAKGIAPEGGSYREATMNLAADANNEAATRDKPSKPAPAFARSWQEPSSGATRFANPAKGIAPEGGS